MSRLYHTEQGNVVAALCEELTTYRRVRKVLDLPQTESAAHIYLLARCYPQHDGPLRLAVNGVEADPIPPVDSDRYVWCETVVEPSLLRDGANLFELWSEATAMTGWSLAMEGGHADPLSTVSDDRGTTWRNERMAYLNALRGEYVVRVRLQEGEDPAPPSMVWEDAENPRLESLHRLIPEDVLQRQDGLEQIRALCTWISSSWEHTNSLRAALYTPWDPETILAWGSAQSGHNGKRTIVMCVHFAVTFSSCCQALGIPARCSAVKGSGPNAANGHFVSEVWSEEYRKWVFVDPTWDAMFWREGAPLSLAEVIEARNALRPLVRWGPGREVRLREPGKQEGIERFLNGYCFGHRALWPRSDFLSRPDLSPSGHGSVAYCETGWVWEEGDLEQGFGMFPYFAGPEYFQSPP